MRHLKPNPWLLNELYDYEIGMTDRIRWASESDFQSGFANGLIAFILKNQEDQLCRFASKLSGSQIGLSEPKFGIISTGSSEPFLCGGRLYNNNVDE